MHFDLYSGTLYPKHYGTVHASPRPRTPAFELLAMRIDREGLLLLVLLLLTPRVEAKKSHLDLNFFSSLYCVSDFFGLKTRHQVDWNKMANDSNTMADKLKKKLHLKSKSGFEKFQDFASKNIYVAGGFTGGFFLGIASS